MLFVRLEKTTACTCLAESSTVAVTEPGMAELSHLVRAVEPGMAELSHLVRAVEPGMAELSHLVRVAWLKFRIVSQTSLFWGNLESYVMILFMLS